MAQRTPNCVLIVGITLNDEHSEGLVSHINGSLDGKSHLEDIFSKADHSEQGRGDVLRAQASNRAAFFQDQRKNSTFFEFHITLMWSPNMLLTCH